MNPIGLVETYDKTIPATALSSNGLYQYQNGASATILGDVAKSTNLGNGTLIYGNLTLSSSGTRTIQFTTTNWTKAQKYTIRVEQYFGGATGYKSDEVDVKVEKGAVTIVAAGDQSYYLGEEVKFSGTNTESQTTYLFITGPNLGQYGSPLSPDNLNPRDRKFGGSADERPATTGQYADDLVQAAVQGDNTWSYKWGTSSIALDAGTYTVYATSQPSSSSADQLSNVAYGTVSIIIKKPFISATASQSTVAKGDAVFITGTAQGQPSDGVRIWILGKNYALIATQSVNSDASFSYEVKKETTKDLYSGQYFIVAQHPMQNNRFDVYPGDINANPASGTSATVVWTLDQSHPDLGNATADFKLSGSNSLQGSDAAEALIEAINSANVDDTYTKLQILVEEPVITIDTIGDRHVGDKFTITATTNLAVDDEVLFEVYSSSFQPTQKSQSGEFSGATGTVKVTKGDSGLNKLSFDVDASTFKPDEYLVKASAVLQEATGTSLFNVLEAQAPTATPTMVANVTAAPTTVATTVPTTVATPTKTPTQPGFGALVALIGLGAVALLVVRRH
jgi:PGF-CTERM protein